MTLQRRNKGDPGQRMGGKDKVSLRISHGKSESNAAKKSQGESTGVFARLKERALTGGMRGVKGKTPKN